MILYAVAPMIVTPPVDVIAVESIPGLYTFQCLATGRPPPTITWFFMAELGAAENTVMGVENTTTITDTEIGDRQIMSNLSFSVRALSDAGVYICSAENVVRNSTVVAAAATLTVYGKSYTYPKMMACLYDCYMYFLSYSGSSCYQCVS